MFNDIKQTPAAKRHKFHCWVCVEGLKVSMNITIRAFWKQICFYYPVFVGRGSWGKRIRPTRGFIKLKSNEVLPLALTRNTKIVCFKTFHYNNIIMMITYTTTIKRSLQFTMDNKKKYQNKIK